MVEVSVDVINPSFEAFVYTTNRAIATWCAKAFSELPIDWIMIDEPRIATQYCADVHFDVFILDIDSPHGAAILKTLCTGANLGSVVLAVTSEVVDPDILDLSYKSQFFYPVRPTRIEEQLHQAMPLVERLYASRPPRVAPKPAEDGLEEIECPAVTGPVRESNPVGRSLLWMTDVAGKLGKATAALFANMFSMRHSLSTVWQERVASGIAAWGAIWLVYELTKDFHGLEYLDAPPNGPSYLIALASLLWLCAKHRRVISGDSQQLAVCVASES
jgi:hypothetical protein